MEVIANVVRYAVASANIKLILICALLSSCAAAKPRAKLVTELPPDCITEMRATEKTHCYGPDAMHIKCDNVQIVRNAGCEKVVVVPK